ncbi:hypothetical protein RWE15_21425 [Virgibacillus halophilus]|uniref:Uncharacterized protein n=1 Tax=Tigheibacillus halophilus TaxID=361280 RepID=A0ABU5CAS5_9BACI|nr:hypothetical protein [Virgibacillus halophilus]
MESLHLLDGNVSILSASWHNFFAYIGGQGSAVQTGGGIVGALLLTFSYFFVFISRYKNRFGVLHVSWNSVLDRVFYRRLFLEKR